MYIIFLVIMIVLLIALATISTISERKLRGVFITEKMRCMNYYLSMMMLWDLVIIIVIMSFFGGISAADLGLRAISFDHSLWFTLITIIICGGFLGVLLFQTISTIVNPKSREKTLENTPKDGAYQILPRTKKEKILFTLLSVTAGICEEIIFRGFLVFLLKSVFPDISLILIIVISSLIFGFSHGYQGLLGVLETGAVGVLLLCLIVVTDSLILAMILHFVIDFSNAFLLSEDDAVREKEEFEENENLLEKKD